MRDSGTGAAAARVGIALLCGFALAGAVVAASGRDPAAALEALAVGAYGSIPGTLRSLTKATPLLFAGLALAVPLRAGLFNVGVEGQLLIGAVAAAAAGAANTDLPPGAHALLAMTAGCVAGALWALAPALLRAYRGTHEVIVTIMMNYIAGYLTHYLASGPMKDPASSAPATHHVAPGAVLWAPINGSGFGAGFLVALAAAAGVGWLFARTRLGLEIRAVGASPDAARAAGVRVRRTMVSSMLISGCLGGTAGAVEVLAVHHRFLAAFSPGYGFDGIAVALLGDLNAFGITLSALLFGGLASGSVHMESWTDTPRQIAGIVQAVVIVAAGARFLRRRT